MPTTAFGAEAQAVFDAANVRSVRSVQIGGQAVQIQVPFASPMDWRDQWIYFLMVDRFNNPAEPPRSESATPPVPFDQKFGAFQGGSFTGIRVQLDYIKELGAGAIWLSPVLKNCQYEDGTYHGYGIQDFMRAEPRFSADPAAAKQDPDLADAELRALVDAIHARGMYVIFDIVLNHAGDVFAYLVDGRASADAPFRDKEYDVLWRDNGGNPSFPDIASPGALLTADAGVWPAELQHNEFFRRKGVGADAPRAQGDFSILKQMVSENLDLGRTLIRSYQYVIARFDVDGFRIDTFKLVDPGFGHTFCNSMREYALSIGKENFFTFGEITTGEDGLAQFIGRDTKTDQDQPIGIDAALDFQLQGTLGGAVKGQGQTSPQALAQMYETRKRVERTIITTHGEASSFFVTFLDNHDGHQRFLFEDTADSQRFDNQLTLALGALFGLQGIPCVYYGTEQGLHGIGDAPEYVREALWGKAPAFDRNHPFYQLLKALAQVRAEQPALRYGRQYFRQISGDGVNFGISSFSPGVIAFSRILDAHEVLLVANPAEHDEFAGEVVVDGMLQAAEGAFRVLFSNQPNPQSPAPLATRKQGTVTVRELDGRTTVGPVRVLPVRLRDFEIQILAR